MSDLQQIIQKAFEAERKYRPDFYEPSPGQLMGHVDYRVSCVAAQIAEAWLKERGISAEQQ